MRTSQLSVTSTNSDYFSLIGNLTKNILPTLILLLPIFLLASGIIYAQDNGCGKGDLSAKCGSPTDSKPEKQIKGDKDSPSTRRASASLLPYRSSPINPPDKADNKFVEDEQAALDTGCVYRNQFEYLTIRTKVTRVISKTKTRLTEAEVLNLKNSGVLGETFAELQLPAFDVDVADGEIDEVYFNGIRIGTLYGQNGRWHLNKFRVPLHLVNFATFSTFSLVPVPGENIIEIKIDTQTPIPTWCTEVDWTAMKILVASPIIFVHGQGSNGGFFARQGFTAKLDEIGFLYDNSINLASDSIKAKGAQLNLEFSLVVRSLGVDSVHFVAHSKGGLDLREYLANHHRDPRFGQLFKVLSYTSLSTPHNGSVAADATITYRNNIVSMLIAGETNGIPTALLAGAGTVNEGHRALPTWELAKFNSTNIPILQKKFRTLFNDRFFIHTTAADADKDNSGYLTLYPDELSQLADEAGMPSWIYPITVNGAKGIHRFIYSNRAVKLVPNIYGAYTIQAVPDTAPNYNDGLVTLDSAKGKFSFESLTDYHTIFQGNSRGRNHSTIADYGVAAEVLPAIFQAERQQGDLKP